MNRLLTGCLCALLVFSLSACNSAAEPTPSPTAAPTATPAPTPSAKPTPTPPSTAQNPITEESLRKSEDFINSEIYEVYTDGDHFLVWYGGKGSAPATDWSDLMWVNGRTGARTPFPRAYAIVTGVEVAWPDQVTARTNGISHTNGWRGMPVGYHYIVGEDGQLITQANPWTAVDTALTLGVNRAAVVADARAGVNDLAVVFVPPANEKGLSEFIAAATYIPLVETRLDQGEHILYVTLWDTVLQSGQFQTGGEDWVVKYLAEDMFPTLRLVFRS